MHKTTVYSAVCVGLGVCFLLGSYFIGKQKADSEPVQVITVQQDEASVNEVEILNVSDVNIVTEMLGNAKDIKVDFTHTLCIGGTDFTIDWAGSGYNYVTKRGHISAIHVNSNVDLWWDSDTFLLSSGDGFTDSDEFVEIKDKESNVINTNISTINMVVDRVSGSVDTKVSRFSDRIKYTLITSDSTYNNELLQVTTSSTVKKVLWTVEVPDDLSGEFIVTLYIYPDENSLNIDNEKLKYVFSIDNGYDYEIPNFEEIEENTYEISGDYDEAVG